MRKIHIDADLMIGFPGRDESFREGVEIGMLATLMILKEPEISRVISMQTYEQAEAVARKLGYHIADLEEAGEDSVRITLRNTRQRPKLRLVVQNHF